MSPYEIDILLWYYARAEDHPDIQRNPPVWRPTIDSFLSEGLLETPARDGMTYGITERGRAYVSALQRVPLPCSAWIIDWPVTHIQSAQNIG